MAETRRRKMHFQIYLDVISSSKIMTGSHFVLINNQKNDSETTFPEVVDVFKLIGNVNSDKYQT